MSLRGAGAAHRPYTAPRLSRGGPAIRFRLGAAPLVLLIAVLPFALLELALAALDFRFVPPVLVPMHQGQQGQHLTLETEQFRAHPRWFWELRPGAVVVRGTGEVVNRHGFRGPAPGARPPAGRLRVAALGDSSTFGVFVRDAQTWPRRLEQRLPVEVLNFGVPGYTVFQGLELYRERVRSFAPAVVVVAFGAFNEAAPADPPARERARILQAPANRLLYGLDAALLRFRWYQLPRWALAQLRDERVISERNMDRYERNLVHWQAGEVWRPEVDVDEFAEMLEALVREVRADGAGVLLVSPPRRAEIERDLPALLHYTRGIRSVAERTGAPLCPVRSVFRREGDALLADSVHPSARGHERYAEVVAECLVRAGLVAAAGDSS